MSTKVDLYESAYANYGFEVYRHIRMETYGQDLGETSWVITEESSEIPRMFHLEVAGSNGRECSAPCAAPMPLSPCAAVSSVANSKTTGSRAG